LKHYRIPVYFLRMRGQYLTSTKHFLEERKGYTEAELVLLYTPEQLDAMTADEIQDGINEAFRHDEFDWNREKGYRWNMHGRSCEHLHEICYRCPRCGEDLSMEGKGSVIRCKVCGNGAELDDCYAFRPLDSSCVIPESPTRWVEQERVNVIRAIRADPDYSFTEHVRLGKIPEDRTIGKKQTSVLCGEGDLTWDHAGIHYRGTKDGSDWSFDLGYETVYSLVIMTSTDHFALYVNEDFYEFFPDRPSVGKALLVTEEMHRLHVNTWKNFPWNDWMYEDAEGGSAGGRT
ncbi:MAG: hypothetical protein ILO68_08310, partial [Clostridia bacterium]|nr:hypothetical protein [Clostridia bacterium]